MTWKQQQAYHWVFWILWYVFFLPPWGSWNPIFLITKVNNTYEHSNSFLCLFVYCHEEQKKKKKWLGDDFRFKFSGTPTILLIKALSLSGNQELYQNQNLRERKFTFLRWITRRNEEQKLFFLSLGWWHSITLIRYRAPFN